MNVIFYCIKQRKKRRTAFSSLVLPCAPQLQLILYLHFFIFFYSLYQDQDTLEMLQKHSEQSN